MTDIEQKAQALINTITKLKFNGNIKFTRSGYMAEALCRAIEQHEAFRQEVSDELIKHGFINASTGIGRFIIPASKPDPLVEALTEISGEGGFDNFDHYAHNLRAALEARGLEIREKSDD